MATYRRRGHYRRSGTGRPVWVREHTVSRSGGQVRQLSRVQGVSAPAGWVTPNASCPVCGAAVYFYANEYGSRVFFDGLGPPWPKHPCTIQQEHVRTPASVVVPTVRKGSGGLTSLSNHGRPLVVAEVMSGGGHGTFLYLNSLQPGGRGNAWHSKKDLAVARGQIVFMSADVMSYVDMRTMAPASAPLQFGRGPSRIRQNTGPSLFQRIAGLFRG